MAATARGDLRTTGAPSVRRGALSRACTLERACRLQILALGGGAEANPVPDEVVRHAVDQGPMIYGKGGQSAGGALVWSALLRKLDRENPGYDV